MDDRYTIRVTVTDPDGNAVFELTTQGEQADIFLPGHATPGAKPVLEYLARATDAGDIAIQR